MAWLLVLGLAGGADAGAGSGLAGGPPYRSIIRREHSLYIDRHRMVAGTGRSSSRSGSEGSASGR